MSNRIELNKGEDEHDVSKVSGSVSRNLEVAVVELEQPPLKGSIIDICDL